MIDEIFIFCSVAEKKHQFLSSRKENTLSMCTLGSLSWRLLQTSQGSNFLAKSHQNNLHEIKFTKSCFQHHRTSFIETHLLQNIQVIYIKKNDIHSFIHTFINILQTKLICCKLIVIKLIVIKTVPKRISKARISFVPLDSRTTWLAIPHESEHLIGCCCCQSLGQPLLEQDEDAVPCQTQLRKVFCSGRVHVCTMSRSWEWVRERDDQIHLYYHNWLANITRFTADLQKKYINITFSFFL